MADRIPVFVTAVCVVFLVAGCGSESSPQVSVDADDSNVTDADNRQDNAGVDVSGTDVFTDAVGTDHVVPSDSPGSDAAVDLSTADHGAPECTDSAQCQYGNVCIEHQCVPGCNGDRDCPDGTHCDPDALPYGFCAQCLSADHCDTSAGQKCVDGVCKTSCSSDGDCSGITGATFCDRSSGICVQCLSDGSCPEGTLCLDFACRPGCRSDRDCPDQLRCDPKSGPDGDCFPCVQDSDCGLKVCRDHQCVVDCSAVNCPLETPVCDPETGSCHECLNKSDCRPGNLCLGRKCITGCEIDTDCADDRHCHQGSCVECTSDLHCTDGKKCRSNTCSSAECYRDGDCGGGKYCHPLLSSCETLPSKYCASSQDCLSVIPGLLDQYCDPLTRQCINACMAGFCLDLLGSGRDTCVDGGCYGCGSDSDCSGVRCDPFDRWCRACGSNADCAVPGWQCAGDGACYECLNDGHCAHPKVCDTAGGNRCVDCLDSNDCLDSSKPVCGKSKTCIAPCSNECSSGQSICNPDDTEEPISILSCGDFDDDPCLEYGGISGCGSGASCRTQVGGQGRCVCQNECSSGQKWCATGSTDTVESCAQNSQSGCWYISTSYCGYGEVCSSGSCVCSNECTVNQKVCTSSSAYKQCVEDYYTGCPYWASYSCSSGYTCRNGTCQ